MIIRKTRQLALLQRPQHVIGEKSCILLRGWLHSKVAITKLEFLGHFLRERKKSTNTIDIRQPVIILIKTNIKIKTTLILKNSNECRVYAHIYKLQTSNIDKYTHCAIEIKCGVDSIKLKLPIVPD